MGSPTIFSGRYTKLLTNKGILNSDGSLNQNDGPINYVKYAEFEQNVTTGWSLGTTGTLTNAIPTGAPTFGSGASGNLSIATSNVSPIRDNFSLRYVSSAATTAGNMLATDALTIDAADQAKVLTYKFYYSVVSGATTANFSGTSSNSFGVAIWDVTNSAWIGVAGNFSMTQNSGVGIASGTFQTNSNTSQIRLVIYNANATSGAITLAFDDFFVGPQTAPIGPVVTDWVSYTPTVTYISGGATNVTHTGRWRRIGDQIEISVSSNFSAASAGFARPTYSLPSGLSFDTSKFTSSGFPDFIIGDSRVADTGNNVTIGQVSYNTSNTFYPFATCVRTHTGTAQVEFLEITNTSPWTMGNGDSISSIVRAPISGWSSNVQLSNDTDTRVVAASYAFGNTGLTSTAAIAGIWVQVYDTHGAFTNANGRYTAPVSGYYRISVLSARTSGTGNSVAVYRDGVGYQTLFAYYGAAARCSGSITIYCNAGQYLTIGVDGAFTADMIFSVERLSGPSVVAASETVAMRAVKNSGSHTANNSNQDVASWTGKDIDTHNSFNITTGIYTVPVSGVYAIGAVVSLAPNSTGGRVTTITVNATAVASSNIYNSFPDVSAMVCNAIYRCNAGDTIKLVTYQNSGGNLAYNNAGERNNLNIVRVGN